MKRLIWILLLAGAVVAGGADEDVTLSNGAVLHHARIAKFFAGEFVIEHDGGIAHVAWADMPAAVRAQYHFDPTKAEQEKQAAEMKRQSAVLQTESKVPALNTHSIAEVGADLVGFDRREVSFEGEITISDYFNFGFSGSEEVFSSFQLNDSDGKSMHVYFRRDAAKPLRDALVAARKPLRALVTVYIDRSRNELHELLAEGLSYRLLND